jgi:nucleoside-diphosphate-sugar epimerase
MTIMAFVPSTLSGFLDTAAHRPGLRLRVACCGGEVLSPELAARYREGTSARLFNVYGPGNDKGVIWRWMNKSIPCIYGDGEQVRDYIHVDDVCRAFMAAADRGEAGTFDVGTGRGTSLNELAEVMGITPMRMAAVDGDERRSVSGNDDYEWGFPNLRIWEPTITLERGIAMLRGGQ